MMPSLLLFAALLAAPDPLAVVKNGNAEVQKLRADPASTTEKLSRRTDEYIDFAELAKRALGKEWDKLKPAQQVEFAQTMKAVLRASYAQRALGDGQGGAVTEYGDQKITGQEASVETTLVLAGDRFPIEYRLYRREPTGPWRIYDVVTDSVSLVDTYRDQFRQLIAKKGYEGLLQTLKNRREQLEKRL